MKCIKSKHHAITSLTEIHSSEWINNLDKEQCSPSGHQLDPVVFALMPSYGKISKQMAESFIGTVASIHYLTENGAQNLFVLFMYYFVRSKGAVS